MHEGSGRLAEALAAELEAPLLEVGPGLLAQAQAKVGCVLVCCATVPPPPLHFSPERASLSSHRQTPCYASRARSGSFRTGSSRRRPSSRELSCCSTTSTSSRTARPVGMPGCSSWPVRLPPPNPPSARLASQGFFTTAHTHGLCVFFAPDLCLYLEMCATQPRQSTVVLVATSRPETLSADLLGHLRLRVHVGLPEVSLLARVGVIWTLERASRQRGAPLDGLMGTLLPSQASTRVHDCAEADRRLFDHSIA